MRPADAHPYHYQCRADKDGFIRWTADRRRRIHISNALAHQTVSLFPRSEEARWDLYYGPILLGSIDEARLDRGLIRPPRPKRRRPLTSVSLESEVSS